jgi:hypothetical protein
VARAARAVAASNSRRLLGPWLMDRFLLGGA